LVIDKEKILDAAQKYIQKGQPKKAIKEYLRLIDSNPKDKRLYLKLGDIYLKSGDNESAIKEYLKLAELYEEDDLNFRAISAYKKVLSINPRFFDAFHSMAKLYLKEGLIGSAKNCYQTLLEIRPGDKEAIKAIEEMGKHPAVKEEVEEVRPAEPFLPKPRPPAKKQVAETMDRIYAAPAAPMETPILPLEDEIPSPDKDSEMHYHLGIAYKEMELFDYAISEFEMASSGPAMRFDCYIMLGSCSMEKGDYEKSIDYFKMASEIKGLSDEKLARLHYHLGLAYEAYGRIPEALQSFTSAYKLDPSSQEAQEKMRKLQSR
jgi:tetratricopeptide (TPR) repeat protein